MADVFDQEKRSQIMSKVRARDTKPELAVRRFLHAHGLRFRLHRKDLPGTPDLVFPSRRVAVFVHGCFWHQHPGCSKAKLPETRANFWSKKLTANVKRDARAMEALRVAGWTPIVLWECEIIDSALEALEQAIRGAGIR